MIQVSYLLRKLFDVNRGEEQKALLMFSYIFFIIASLLILKSIRDSLLLIKLGIESLPYAFLLTALSAIFIMSIYTKIIKKIKFNKPV